MVASFTFNGTNLEQYGLEINRILSPFRFEPKYAQLADRAYGFRALRLGKNIRVTGYVYANNSEDLLTKLDAIQAVLNVPQVAALTFDHQPDRYWLAQFESFSGPFTGIGAYEVEINFYAPDPMAYAISETISTLPVNTDPWTGTLQVGGTAPAAPIYTLTVGSAPYGSKIQFSNQKTSQTLILNQAPSAGDKYVIDTVRWLVLKNGVPAMKVVEGQFPFAKPGSNTLSLSGAGAGATLKVQYYARFV